MGAGFRTLIIALLLSGVFIIALVNFNVGLIEDNGGNNSLLNDTRINNAYTIINDSLGNSEEQFSTQSDIIAGTEPTSAFNIILDTLAGTWTVFIAIPQVIYQSIFGLTAEVLTGGDAQFNVVWLVIGAILALVITLLAWRFLRSGE